MPHVVYDKQEAEKRAIRATCGRVTGSRARAGPNRGTPGVLYSANDVLQAKGELCSKM